MSPLRLLMIRALIAGSIILAGCGIVYNRAIAPLQRQQAEWLLEIDSLRNQVRLAQDELNAIKDQEQAGWQLRRSLDSLHDGIPVDSAVTWFPPRMKSLLGRLGVEQVGIRLNTTEPEPKLVGYERTFWHVSLPQQSSMRKMTDALLVVAQLEQQDRFVKIMDFSLHAEAQEPAWVAGHVNVMAFVRK